MRIVSFRVMKSHWTVPSSCRSSVMRSSLLSPRAFLCRIMRSPVFGYCCKSGVVVELGGSVACVGSVLFCLMLVGTSPSMLAYFPRPPPLDVVVVLVGCRSGDGSVVGCVVGWYLVFPLMVSSSLFFSLRHSFGLIWFCFLSWWSLSWWSSWL